MAAYMLAQIGGSEQPDEEAVSRILGSITRILVDPDNIKVIISKLSGKDLEELAQMGAQDMQALSTPILPTAADTPTPPHSSSNLISSAAEAKEVVPPIKESKEQTEEKEYSDEDLGFSLFD